MAAAVVTAVCWMLFFVLAGEGEGKYQICWKFSDLNIQKRGESKTYNCPARNCSTGKVIGTNQYAEDSDICLAALHAGVLPSLGANVIVTRQDGATHVNGTLKNRIISESKDRDTKLRTYKVDSEVQETGEVAEVLMVHNSASNGVLRFTCLSQDQVSPISSSSIKGVWYTSIAGIKADITSGENSPRLVFEFAMNKNIRAVRIQGSRADNDVFAVVQYPNGDYQSKLATVRASVGDNVIIQIQKKRGKTNMPVHFRQFPNAWSNSSYSNLSSYLTPADPSKAGLYIVHDTIDTGSIYGAYFELVVRECKAGSFGLNCSKKCPRCENGGQCHTRRGTCLCPPGFIGDTCQYACLPGLYGNKCQFRCGQETFDHPKDEEKEVEQEGKCMGLTICLPPPYGCSCATGFTHPSNIAAPLCTQECSKGYFGADCSQKCLECMNDECNPFSGTCLHECKSGTSCRKGPPAPSFTISGQFRSYHASLKAFQSDAHYFLSQQLLEHLSCTSGGTKRPREYHTLVTSVYSASNLFPYATYKVCIVTSSRIGLSNSNCSNVTTHPEVPDLSIIDLKCEEEREELKCSADVDGECDKYNGPNVSISFTLHTEPPCPKLNTTLSSHAKLQGTTAQVTFANYLAGVQYQVKATVYNSLGNGKTQVQNFSTVAKDPPPVQNVTFNILSDSALQLLWKDPCPSNGKIEKSEITINNNDKPLYHNCTTTATCSCYKITELELGKDYTFHIKQKNSAGWSFAEYKFKFEAREPGIVQAIKFVPGTTHLNLTLLPPLDRGGTLKNCTIILTNSKNCTIPFKEGNSRLNCTISDLEEGKIQKAKAHCCNTKLCGKDLNESVATKAIPPQLTGSLSILRKTDSTITLHLPAFTRDGDGKHSLIIIVQLEVQTKSLNLSATIQTLLEEHDRQTRRKRNTNEREAQCQKEEWIAAELQQGDMMFVVGDGEIYNGFLNCPLKLGEIVNIGTMGASELLGQKSYSQLLIEREVVVEPYEPPASNLLLLFLLLLILPVLVLLANYRLRNQPISGEPNIKSNTGTSQEDLATPCESSETFANHGHQIEIVTNSHPDPRTQYDELNETIYENLKPEESCAIVSSNIPLSEVEAYLNKVIGSKEVGNDFRTVPLTLNKSMMVARRPENKIKNRYINNLPYDDTRVVLERVGEDAASDYINANHVQGYGNMRYIASQGPKDGKASTIADFWRMVVEQKITVIIMVANFVEKGKKKVGEYFIPGQTLNFDGFEVVVHSMEQLPHFTVSSLLVRRGEETYKVQHYHYTNWPDHGIPTEAKSIAQMLSHFQSHHTRGGTVVHCSAGIGRTGTVLQVLLMCETLNLKGYLSPIEVLARLRMSRSRLVENEAQYNLSLEILDEILFGKKTIVSTDGILNHLDKYVAMGKTQFAKAKALPSPLSFTTSNLPIFQPLNRNQSVLPADSNRFYLQPKPGVDALLSQYINTIRVPGSSRQEFMLVTEHPLPYTIASFWRLVVETGCTLVIFVNSLQNQRKSDFPTMIMEPGKVWQVEQYELQVEQTVPYGIWLRQSTLTITSNEDWIHRVDVYQSMEWPVGSQLPPSTYLLLTLAELMQIPRGHTSGPPLLCCSDGVTGCGLVAGMTLIVEQLQNEQVIDVYRTVVKLLRARQQFIVSEEQFFMLYTSAATYLKEYSSYGNFQ